MITDLKAKAATPEGQSMIQSLVEHLKEFELTPTGKEIVSQVRALLKK